MLRRIGVAALVLAIAVIGLPAGPAGAAWSAPTLTRLISGPSEPQIYAWGMDYNPVTDELLVSDYLNRRIRRFDRNGEYLGSFGENSVSGFYAGVAVDPSDGSSYVHTFGGDSAFVKFDVNGDFMYDFDLPGVSAFLAFGPDGHLYGNRHKCCVVTKIDVNDSTQSATIVRSFGGNKGTDPGEVLQVTGVDVASDGRVFAVDPGNGVVHVWAANGNWLYDFASKGNGPGKLPGDARGLVLDEANDRVFVADSDSSEIEVFTLGGTHVRTFGSVGTAPGQFSDGAREMAVTPDGHLWTADYGNFRIQRFTPDGTVLSVSPDPAAEADPWGLSRPRDASIDPTNGELLVADPWNQRFSRFTTTGELIEARGRRGSVPPDGVNYPRSIGVDPDTGNVWLPNYEGVPGITVLRPDGSYLRSIDVPQFANDVAFHDGQAYVPFRGGNGIIRIFDTATGALTRTIGLSDVLNGIDIDPATGHLYVAHDSRREVRIYDNAGNRIGDLDVSSTPWGVDIVGDVIYVTDTGAGRVFAFDRTSWATLGSFGTKGGDLGQLALPSGLDHDAAGNLYIADAGTGQIQVWSPTGAAADAVAPTVAVTSPADQSTVGDIPLVVEGTAADTGRGVAIVEVAVMDRTTNLWWDATESSWGVTRWNRAPVHGDLSAPAWRFAHVGAQLGGSYYFQIRATDFAGNTSDVQTLRVDVGDVEAPETTMTSPASGAVAAGALALAGDASDDRALTAVEVQVLDGVTGLFWDGGTWQGDAVWTPASLAAPGMPTSSWTGTFDDGGTGSGTYTIRARAVDESANVDPTPAEVNVEVGGEDSVAPDTTLDSPAVGATVTVGSPVSGTATDNVAVQTVQISLKDRATNLWWDETSDTWGAFVWNDATPASPGSPTSAWSWTPSIGTGDYYAQARAVDASGNVDESRATTRFLVVGTGADTTDPDTTLDEPANNAAVVEAPVIAGQATDDVGVGQVQVAIQDRVSKQWWNQATGSFGGFGWNDAALASPGAGSTAWSLTTTLPPGDYFAQARSVDSTGNIDQSRATTKFVYTDGQGVIDVDRWNGFSGTSLSSIPAATAPTTSELVALPAGLVLDTDSDDFGARMRLLVEPPTSASYTFWLVSDDNGVLRLNNSGTDPNGATTIATVPGWANLGEWTKFTEQRSSPIALTAGQQYYLEVAFKEGGGGDHAAVAWSTGGGSPQLIPASAFSPAGALGADGWETSGSGTLPWNEDFSLPNGTTVDTGDTAWTVTTPSAGHARVESGKLEVRGSSSQVEWRSGTIGISGGPVSVQIDWEGTGPMEDADNIQAYYRLDGGPEVLIASHTDSFSAETVSVGSLSGSTLQIIIRAQNSASDEDYRIDRVRVA